MLAIFESLVCAWHVFTMAYTLFLAFKIVGLSSCQHQFKSQYQHRTLDFTVHVVLKRQNVNILPSLYTTPGIIYFCVLSIGSSVCYLNWDCIVEFLRILYLKQAGNMCFSVLRFTTSDYPLMSSVIRNSWGVTHVEIFYCFVPEDMYIFFIFSRTYIILILCFHLIIITIFSYN